MLNKLMGLMWRGFVPAILACLLPACGGGGGEEDEASPEGIRPLSLNGVTLDFGGARLTFTTPTPNTVGTSTEIGGIFYEQRNNAPVVFTPADSTRLDGVSLTWPADLGGATRYEYTPVDGSTARLLVYPDSTEGGIFDSSAGPFDTIVLSFAASGNVITSIQAVMTVNNSGSRFVSTFFPIGTIGGLSGSPRPLPASWNGVNTGAGYLAPSSFSGNVLTLNETGGDVEVQFGPFIASGGVTTQTNSTTERGTVSILFTEGLLLLPPGTETTSVFEADYTMVQPFGTENVQLQIVYRSGTASLPANETIILSFTGGGKITSGVGSVDIRTGIYARENGTNGSFILDTR